MAIKDFFVVLAGKHYQATVLLYPAALINLSNIDNFSYEKITGMLGIEPGAAG